MLQLDFDAGVPATDDGGYTLSIEGPFVYQSGSERLQVDPASPPPVILRLRDKRVQEALADEDGTLRLSFADGDLLTVPPDNYEPWQLVSTRSPVDGGWLVVSVAGGGLSVWLPRVT
jgi:hypothetical protein